MPQIEMRKIPNIIMVKDKFIIVQSAKNTRKTKYAFQIKESLMFKK